MGEHPRGTDQLTSITLVTVFSVNNIYSASSPKNSERLRRLQMTTKVCILSYRHTRARATHTHTNTWAAHAHVYLRTPPPLPAPTRTHAHAQAHHTHTHTHTNYKFMHYWWWVGGEEKKNRQICMQKRRDGFELWLKISRVTRNAWQNSIDGLLLFRGSSAKIAASHRARGSPNFKHWFTTSNHCHSWIV